MSAFENYLAKINKGQMSVVAHPVYPLLGPSLITIAYKKDHGNLPLIVGAYMLNGGYTSRALALNVAQNLSYNPPNTPTTNP